MADVSEQERLRRALYRPGATEEDRARYAALTQRAAASAGGVVDATAGPPQPPPAPASPGPPATGPGSPAPAPTARRLRPALLLGLSAVAVMAVTASLLAAPVAPDPVPSATPADVVVQEVVYADAGTVQTFRGRGDATVPLDAAIAPGGEGSLSVVLAPDRTARVGWRVLRDGSVLARQAATSTRRSDVTPTTVPFRDGAPTALAVEAPDRPRWTLTVTLLRAARAG